MLFSKEKDERCVWQSERRWISLESTDDSLHKAVSVWRKLHLLLSGACGPNCGSQDIGLLIGLMCKSHGKADDDVVYLVISCTYRV